MITELLNELVNEMSPFYLYISILLTIFSSYHFLSIGVQSVTRDHDILTRKYHDIRIRLLPMQELYGEIAEVLDWITRKTERIASPDDDTDNQPFSFLKLFLQLRGGQQWKIILYSLFLKNTALLV